MIFLPSRGLQGVPTERSVGGAGDGIVHAGEEQHQGSVHGPSVAGGPHGDADVGGAGGFGKGADEAMLPNEPEKSSAVAEAVQQGTTATVATSTAVPQESEESLAKRQRLDIKDRELQQQVLADSAKFVEKIKATEAMDSQEDL